MELLQKLIILAGELDNAGFYKYAASIDALLKQATQDSERFWSKVEKTPTCWVWTGAKARNGYGICTINKKNYMSHRLSWEWYNDKLIPKDYVVCHKCDNPACVNPKHLFLHTQKGNVDDRVKKNRSARGKNNGRARLNDKNIRLIKKLRTKGLTESAIAKLLGVGRSTISNVLHGRTWNWVE